MDKIFTLNPLFMLFGFGAVDGKSDASGLVTAFDMSTPAGLAHAHAGTNSGQVGADAGAAPASGAGAVPASGCGDVAAGAASGGVPSAGVSATWQPLGAVVSGASLSGPASSGPSSAGSSS